MWGYGCVCMGGMLVVRLYQSDGYFRDVVYSIERQANDSLRGDVDDGNKILGRNKTPQENDTDRTIY